jgi:putative GTP pyrophosphokinase
MQHQLLQEYDQTLPLYQLVATEMAKTLEDLHSNPAVKIHSISHRIKSKDSFAKKLERPDRIYKKLNDVTDVIGFRIITYFEDGIDDAARFVEKHFSLDLRNSEDKRLKSSLDQFGYRSLHYVCRPANSFFNAHKIPFDPEFCFEIQIRTILEHAWAEIEHDLGYKSSHGVPASIRRRFSRLSGLLELADQEFAMIRKSLMSYEIEAAQKITDATDELPIDSVTLKAFLDEGATAQAELQIAEELGIETSSQLFFIDYLVQMLNLAGLTTIEQLSHSLKRYESQIRSFMGDYFKFTQRAWNFSKTHIDSVKVGYCLLFIAHINILESTKLDVELIDAMTQFYAALDYEDDTEMAKVVAIQFLECVSRT